MMRFFCSKRNYQPVYTSGGSIWASPLEAHGDLELDFVMIFLEFWTTFVQCTFKLSKELEMLEDLSPNSKVRKLHLNCAYTYVLCTYTG